MDIYAKLMFNFTFFSPSFYSIKLGTGTTLLIPVEVEVIPRTGLYVPGSKIDFESGGHLDPPAVRPLHLCSSAKKTVTIEVNICLGKLQSYSRAKMCVHLHRTHLPLFQNISCESRIDGCEVVDFRPTALPPWSCAVNPVAKVKFVCKLFRFCFGEFMIVCNHRS